MLETFRIRIDKKIRPLIFDKATEENKTMSDVVNEVLLKGLVKSGEISDIRYGCTVCGKYDNKPIDHNKGCCPHCKRITFLKYPDRSKLLY